MQVKATIKIEVSMCPVSMAKMPRKQPMTPMDMRSTWTCRRRSGKIDRIVAPETAQHVFNLDIGHLPSNMTGKGLVCLWNAFCK